MLMRRKFIIVFMISFIWIVLCIVAICWQGLNTSLNYLTDKQMLCDDFDTNYTVHYLSQLQCHAASLFVCLSVFRFCILKVCDEPLVKFV